MRSFSFLCASACIFAVACGGSESSNNAGNDAGPETSTVDDTGAQAVDTGAVVDDTGTVVDDTGTEPTDSGPADTGTEPVDSGPPDYGSPSTTYPAFTPVVGQVASGGGLTLSAPQIVSIAWSSDANANSLYTFGDTLGATNWWSASTTEYGVGAAVSGASNHVVVKTSAPGSMTDDDIQNLITTNLSDSTSGWPQPTDNTIYLVYVPFGTSLDYAGQGNACNLGIGGYHADFSFGGRKIVYGVVTSCRLLSNNVLVNQTAFGSHEIVEAATDPHPPIAYDGFDQPSLNWEFLFDFQSELGDACEYFDDSFFNDKEGSFNFEVQRIWSNKSIAAGHNPCVPAAGTYFSVTTLTPEQQVIVNLSSLGSSSIYKTKGYNVSVGKSITIPLGFYSDGAMNAWSISAREGSEFAFGDIAASSKNFTLSLDHTTGQNGEKSYLTVTAKAQPAAKAQIVEIKSSNGSAVHYYPILIGVQ